MGDPFEEFPALPPSQPPPLRESSVQQAVTFLSDPRVRGADPTRAITFLRTKGISEAELQEAYRRSSLPFPSFPASHMQVVPLAPPTPPPRTSWLSLFIGLTAAAGIYTAAREILRRYVVPLYFPDAARLAEERRRREEHIYIAHQQQLSELRASVENLRATSEQTSQQLENLSRSVSSSIVTQERDKSSQLKDNIRQVSQNVTVSTEASRKERAPHSSHKPGSVGYGHDAHVETSTARLSMERGADENRMLDVDGRNRVDEEDEFMAIAPAEVDNSWVSGQFGMGKAEVKQDEEYGMGKEEGHTTIQQKDLRKSVNGLSNEAKVVAGQADNRWIASNNEKENEDLYEGGVGEEEEVVEGQGLSETSRLLAQKLFQRDLMHEAQQWAVNDNGSKDGTSMKNRPLSMPQMDTPLSDTDY